MIEFKTLENLTTTQLATTFNLAFSDYATKLHLTEEAMELKFKTENTTLKYSAGAFDGDQLVAFIFIGLDSIADQKFAYNGGTGVVPSHRGQRLPQRIYDFILPVLSKAGYKKHLLEVMDGNEKAIRSYEKTGFTKIRKLNCYKGSVADIGTSDIQVSILRNPDWRVLEGFRDVTPSWQNSTSSILRTIDSHLVVGAFQNDILIGYAVMAPDNGRIKQFAVQKENRRKGAGTALFQYLNANSKTGLIMFTNYDDADAGAQHFFNRLGLECFITQHEMSMACL